MSFANLKKTRSTNLSRLVQESQKITNQPNNNSNSDDRFWKPEVDKSGNGYAVIRFLPEPNGEDLPWVRLFDHGFQGPGGWYIENSLTSIGEKDPVGEFNSSLWNNGTDAGKEQARKQKRRLKYFSNIYIVKDPANPSNEGKVFLYQYGKKIWDKLNEAMNPEFEDEAPVNPFEFWEGANFKLKIRKVEGYRNYDKSEFEASSPLLGGDDDKLEKVYSSLYSLSEFLEKQNFKTYAELKEKMVRVLALNLEETTKESPVQETARPAPMKSASEPKVSEELFDDDNLSFFEKLAEED
jgi:hypothetical protein